MIPLALLSLAQPELNCQDAAPVVLVCGGCAYYQNAKKKKAVEVGLDADSLEFKGVGP